AGSFTLTVGNKGIDTTYAGTIYDTTVNATTNFTKVGNGTLVMTGGSSGNGWVGTTTVSAGTLIYRGATGSSNLAGGNTIGLGATLRLDNSAGNNNDRINDGTSTRVTMNGGSLVFVGDRVTPTAEVAGDLRITSGANHVQAIASGVGGT